MSLSLFHRVPAERAALRIAAGVLAMSIPVHVSHAVEVYRWTDAEGKVHFGDRRPPGDAQTVTIRPAPAPGGPGRARRERTRRLVDTFAAEREERRDARDRARAQAAERKRNCALARAEQRRRETARHLFYRDAEGNKRILEGAEYEGAIEQARAAVREWCG